MGGGIMKEASLTTPEEFVELAGLYDVYGALLKDNQREIFEAYILDNLSLSEIAEEQGVTRQGVYDTINRSRKKLREYEKRLGLQRRSNAISERLQTMEHILSREETENVPFSDVRNKLMIEISEIRELL